MRFSAQNGTLSGFEWDPCYMKIGFIGAGKMGLALANGIVQSQPQHTILISDPSAEARELFLEQMPETGF